MNLCFILMKMNFKVSKSKITDRSLFKRMFLTPCYESCDLTTSQNVWVLAPGVPTRPLYRPLSHSPAGSQAVLSPPRVARADAWPYHRLVILSQSLQEWPQPMGVEWGEGYSSWTTPGRPEAFPSIQPRCPKQHLGAQFATRHPFYGSTSPPRLPAPFPEQDCLQSPPK